MEVLHGCLLLGGNDRVHYFFLDVYVLVRALELFHKDFLYQIYNLFWGRNVLLSLKDSASWPFVNHHNVPGMRCLDHIALNLG